MRRRFPAALAGICCALVTLGPVGAAAAQGSGPLDTNVTQETGSAWPGGVSPGGPVVELPPLPPADDDDAEPVHDEEGTTGVQTLALGLAGAALVAGAAGLAVVTRRGRGGDEQGIDGEEADDDGADLSAGSRRDLGLAGDTGR